MIPEAWNLTPEHGNGMPELVMTIGLVPCWSEQGETSAAGEPRASAPAPLLATHLALPGPLPVVEPGRWKNQNLLDQLIILPALRARHYHPHPADEETHAPSSVTCPRPFSLASHWLLSSTSKMFIMGFFSFDIYEIMGSSRALVHVRGVLCKMSVECMEFGAWKWVRLIQPWLWRLSGEAWGNLWVIPI